LIISVEILIYCWLRTLIFLYVYIQAVPFNINPTLAASLYWAVHCSLPVVWLLHVQMHGIIFLCTDENSEHSSFIRLFNRSKILVNMKYSVTQGACCWDLYKIVGANLLICFLLVFMAMCILVLEIRDFFFYHRAFG
jgi:hypothetical protein